MPGLVNITNFAKQTPLLLANLCNQHDVCSDLITKYRANVNAKDVEGCSPLYYSVCHRDVELVRLLLEHHANCYETNSKLSPLNNAITKYPHPGVIALLFHYGAAIGCNLPEEIKHLSTLMLPERYWLLGTKIPHRL